MRRWLTPLTALLGLGLTPAHARQITPDKAPAAWVAYAETATQTLTGWLNGETPPAPRVRAVLQAAQPSADQPTPPLVVKLWVGRDGLITRVEFAPLPDAQADRDLHGLMQGRQLGLPPRGMRLPLRIALQLAPEKPPGPQASTVEVRPVRALEAAGVAGSSTRRLRPWTG